MSSSLAPYLAQVRHDLERSLKAMEDPPNMVGNRIRSVYPIRPIVELRTGLVSERRLQHSSKEYCLLESSNNSVRLSFAFKQQQGDAIDQAILTKYMRFFQQRAEHYKLLRRKPVEGYSISFLILNTHVCKFGKEPIIDAVVGFLCQVDRECSHLKISINAQARLVATEFMKAF